jgi:hypothetical protein
VGVRVRGKGFRVRVRVREQCQRLVDAGIAARGQAVQVGAADGHLVRVRVRVGVRVGSP